MLVNRVFHYKRSSARNCAPVPISADCCLTAPGQPLAGAWGGARRVGKAVLLPMRAEVLKGHLDALLLATLAGGPRHGYAIKEALRAGSGGRFDLPGGTVYPAARRCLAARATLT